MINKHISEFPIIYANSNPIGKIAVGWGVHTTVADECKAVNIKKALITTTGLRGTGIVDEIKGILNYNGISTEVYNKVTSNPKDHEVMEAYELFVGTQCDGIVSVGGGSSHDCGKAVRIVAANEGRHICDFAAFVTKPWMKDMLKFKPVGIPQIAVNTTAGTGAESTTPAIIKNTQARAKQGIMVRGAAASVALIDPLLVRLMPANYAAWTGWDALTHAFESFLSRIPVPFTHAIQLGAMQLVAENLREFVYNRMNHKACENMCWAESMAAVGISFGAGGGIVHGIGGGIGSLTDCHHGLSNAVVTLPGERYNEASCPEKFAEMARAMGVDTRGMTRIQAADKWFEEMERFLRDLNIQTGNLYSQFGLQEGDAKEIVSRYEHEFVRQGNPRDFNFEETQQLVKSML